jgi:hypothetical protein
MKTKSQTDSTKNSLLFFRKIVLIMAAVFLFFSCNNNDDEPFTPINIEFDVIGSGNLLGAGAEEILPGNYVVNNQSDWNLLLNKMNSFYSSTTSDFTTNNINFQTHLIIAVFDEIRTNPGRTIGITNIIENQNSINVTVLPVGPGGAQNQITQPYQIVRIPITNKPIVFE